MICKRLAVLLVMLLFAVSPVLAEECVRAGVAARSGDHVYLTVDGNLICVDGSIAMKVQGVQTDSVTALNGNAFFLMKGSDGAIRIARCNADGSASTLHVFGGVSKVSGLTAANGVLYVLADSYLYTVDPENGEAERVCDARMTEFVPASETIYYTSADDLYTANHRSLTGGASVTKQVGRLYVLHTETGESELFSDFGAEDLNILNGTLYFHDLSDNYVTGTADNPWLEGKLYRVSAGTVQKERVLPGYDWSYGLVGESVIFYTAEGVMQHCPDGTDILLTQPGGIVNMAFGNEGMLMFDRTENILYGFDGEHMTPVAPVALGSVLRDLGHRPVGLLDTEPTMEPEEP